MKMNTKIVDSLLQIKRQQHRKKTETKKEGCAQSMKTYIKKTLPSKVSSINTSRQLKVQRRMKTQEWKCNRKLLTWLKWNE